LKKIALSPLSPYLHSYTIDIDRNLAFLHDIIFIYFFNFFLKITKGISKSLEIVGIPAQMGQNPGRREEATGWRLRSGLNQFVQTGVERSCFSRNTPQRRTVENN
jgi:hypothetical protein